MAHSPRTPPASASTRGLGPSTVPDPVEPGSDRLPFRQVPGKGTIPPRAGRGVHGPCTHRLRTGPRVDRAGRAYTVFDAVRGGYAAAEIDEVLDRLEGHPGPG